MGKSCEMLRDDLRAVHSALGEVLSCAQPDAPSWRFPEKLSASVTLDDLLEARGADEDGKGGRVLLLEGMVDRLLLLLQSSLKLWNEADGRRSHHLPLSLSSAVRKYCRKLLHGAMSSRELRGQIAAKDEVISSLSSSLNQAQEECQLLQEALRDSTASMGRPSSVQSRCVPYEARGSLKMNRLQSSQSMHLPASHDDMREQLQSSQSTPLISSRSTPLKDNLSTVHSLTTGVETQPKCTTVSTQTTETAFALCVKCSSTQSTLVSAAGRLAELCRSLHLPSLMARTDWEREAEIGGLEPGRWGEAMATDLAAIDSRSRALGEMVDNLGEELTRQKELERALKSKISRLMSESESLQRTIDEGEKRRVRELASCSESSSVRLREVEATQRVLQEHCGQLEEQLSTARGEKVELRALLAEIGGQQSSLGSELREARDREAAVRGSHEALQRQLEKLLAELNQCRCDLEADRLQLSKTTALSHSLERKNKALLCRQSGVLQRLEEMDRETESLRRELADSTTARDQLASRLAGLQAECSSLQTQVAEQESKSATSAKEQQHLHQELADLKLQLASLFTQLEMERENCRLLVDYPSSSDDSSQAHLASLSNRKSQERISANTIRILLLEEQNSELRQTVLRHARETGSQRKTELARPVALWQSAVVSQAQSALLNRGKAAPTMTATHSPANTSTPPPPTIPRPQPASRERLHSQLDPLISAITVTQSGRFANRRDSAGNTETDLGLRASPASTECTLASLDSLCSSSCASITMWTCTNCDRMFPDRIGLHKHQVAAHFIS